MEILTTGEKIKRSRIYKGLTLKEICGDKLSVSKLSCIENDKIKAESQVLQYISQKLSIDYDYLVQSIKDQIKNNMLKLSEVRSHKEYEQRVQYNLNFAINNEYYDVAFELMHLLFSFYLDHERNEDVQTLTSKYYDICTKSSLESNYLIYCKDMGRYFFNNMEYLQAATYYKNVKKLLKEKTEIDHEMLAEVIYNETSCYVMMKNLERASDIGGELEQLEQYVADNIKRAEINVILAILSLKKNKEQFKYYEEKSFRFYGSDLSKKAEAMLKFACSMFTEGMNNEGIEYIENGLKTYPSDNTEGKVSFLIQCVDELVTYDELTLAQSACDEALNLSIELDEIKYIERAYYFKAVILQKEGNYNAAEMYMNLSLDALFKFGNKTERFGRYIEMGNMYYKLGQTADSLKYFSLAMLTEKKL